MQVIVDSDSLVFGMLEKLCVEIVICIDGCVKLCDVVLVNVKLFIGEIEVYVIDVDIFGVLDDLFLLVFGDQDYFEEIWLIYCFLDLCWEMLYNNIMLCLQVVCFICNCMWDQGFIEFQMLIIIVFLFEGVCDFFVFLCLYLGKFYVLLQVLQQFKQLIMVVGFDKYFQIVFCFCDEDLCVDWLLMDFYQLDIEMFFVE